MVLQFKSEFVAPIKKARKLHTIRRDVENKWQPGKKITFVDDGRKPHRRTFGEKKCTGIQKIRMQMIAGHLIIWIDDRALLNREEKQLALNDGFPNVRQFAKWFFPTPEVKSYEGKIIHWTDLRY